tara:strand:- start:71 stop:352 length:282 start_codon:yes stop_codon:yes gene_type:complete
MLSQKSGNLRLGNKVSCAACGVKSRVNVKKVAEENTVMRNPDEEIETIPVLRPSEFPVPRDEKMSYIKSAVPKHKKINHSRSLGFAGNERNKR